MTTNHPQTQAHTQAGKVKKTHFSNSKHHHCSRRGKFEAPPQLSQNAGKTGKSDVEVQLWKHRSTKIINMIKEGPSSQKSKELKIDCTFTQTMFLQRNSVTTIAQEDACKKNKTYERKLHICYQSTKETTRHDDDDHHHRSCYNPNIPTHTKT